MKVVVRVCRALRGHFEHKEARKSNIKNTTTPVVDDEDSILDLDHFVGGVSDQEEGNWRIPFAVEKGQCFVPLKESSSVATKNVKLEEKIVWMKMMLAKRMMRKRKRGAGGAYVAALAGESGFDQQVNKHILCVKTQVCPCCFSLFGESDVRTRAEAEQMAAETLE
ncbi:hypothetical protein Sjap_006086 [Stephania japonica]|uniref:Uncharacterized protein n=1 Tax=Stephania japonica TaxID=461633 RepID=A0AAP0PIK6_9MAGN